MPIADGAPGGPTSLTNLRTRIRTETDTVNDPHITDAELLDWLNVSRLELHDKLISAYGDDYYVATAQITTNATDSAYPLPDGTLYSAAPAFYKLLLVEAVAGGNIAPNSPVTLHPFNLREKNRYLRPLSMLAAPQMFPRYRIIGGDKPTNPTVTGQILFTPLPAASLTIQLWYAPKMEVMTTGSDVADDFSGWLEYAVIDVCIKVLAKQERDISVFAARKMEKDKFLEDKTRNRNIVEPNTVVMTEGESMFGGDFMGGTGVGPWW